jgi:hypothetical protein
MGLRHDDRCLVPGRLVLTFEGAPGPILMGKCELCQRRTGSPTHIGAWFLIERVTIEGAPTAFTRTSGEQGMEATIDFWPNCVTTIW